MAVHRQRRRAGEDVARRQRGFMRTAELNRSRGPQPSSSYAWRRREFNFPFLRQVVYFKYVTRKSDHRALATLRKSAVPCDGDSGLTPAARVKPQTAFHLPGISRSSLLRGSRLSRDRSRGLAKCGGNLSRTQRRSGGHHASNPCKEPAWLASTETSFGPTILPTSRPGPAGSCSRPSSEWQR